MYKYIHADHHEVSKCHTKGKSDEYVALNLGSTQVKETTLALNPR